MNVLRVSRAVFTLHYGRVEKVSRARYIVNHAISTGPHNDAQKMYICTKHVLPLKEGPPRLDWTLSFLPRETSASKVSLEPWMVI